MLEVISIIQLHKLKVEQQLSKIEGQEVKRESHDDDNTKAFDVIIEKNRHEKSWQMRRFLHFLFQLHIKLPNSCIYAIKLRRARGGGRV